MKRIIAVILLVAIGVIVGGGSVLAPAPRIAYAGENSWEDIGKAAAGVLIIGALLGMSKEKVIIVPHGKGYELKLAGDPTLGYFQNRTRNWYIYVFVDGSRTAILVRPGGWKQEVHMDIGVQRIRAEAYVHTYYGDRLVGIYERDFKVDGRMKEERYGWRIIFSERSFRSPLDP